MGFGADQKEKPRRIAARETPRHRLVHQRAGAGGGELAGRGVGGGEGNGRRQNASTFVFVSFQPRVCRCLLEHRNMREKAFNRLGCNVNRALLSDEGLKGAARVVRMCDDGGTLCGG